MQAAGAVIFAAGCPFLPHSPRWLHIVGRHDEARAAWEKLGVSTADIEKTEAAAQREQVQQGSFGVELKQMWQKGVRGRTALGVFLCAKFSRPETPEARKEEVFPERPACEKRTGAYYDASIRDKV